MFIVSTMLAFSAAPDLPNFDGKLQPEYTTEQKLALLEWRTDILLELVNQEIVRRDEYFDELNELYRILLDHVRAQPKPTP